MIILWNGKKNPDAINELRRCECKMWISIQSVQDKSLGINECKSSFQKRMEKLRRELKKKK